MSKVGKRVRTAVQSLPATRWSRIHYVAPRERATASGGEREGGLGRLHHCTNAVSCVRRPIVTACESWSKPVRTKATLLQPYVGASTESSLLS